MKVAITGASGHIGHRLSRELLEYGHEVIAFIRSNNRESIVPEGAEIVVGDVCEKETRKQVVAKADAVVHLAYTEGTFADSVNIQTTKDLLTRSENSGCDVFVFLSTLSAHPEVYDSYEDVYIKTKHRASNWIRETDDDIHTVSLYPSRVIGPGDYKLTRYANYKKVVSNKFLFMPLYKISKTNYIHVDTVVDSIIAGINQQIRNDAIVSGETLTEKEYLRAIAKNSPRDHVFIPTPLAQIWLPTVLDIFGKLEVLPQINYQDVLKKTSYVDQSLPKSLENKSPVHDHGTRSAIDDTFNWYKKNGFL